MTPVTKSGADMTPSVLAIAERAAAATSTKDSSSGFAAENVRRDAKSCRLVVRSVSECLRAVVRRRFNA